MDGNIDVLDEFGRRTGEVLSRKDIHAQGKIHRSARLYLFDQEKRLLIQRRSAYKDHLPNELSISVAGHLDAGEPSFQAIQRELQEELGINPQEVKIEFLFSHRLDKQLSPTFIDCQFNDVYIAFHHFNIAEIQFDEEEVSEVMLVSFSKFKEMVQVSPSVFGDIEKKELKELIYFLGNSLD